MNDTTSTGVDARLSSMLCYAGWWVTGLVFLFAERRNGEVRFHAAQSITAFGILAVLIAGFAAVAGASLSFVPEAFLPLLGAALVTWVAALVLWIVAMWKAANGNAWRIPLAADLADRLV